MQLKRLIMILLVVILAVSAATITVAADTGATLEMAVEVTSSAAISDSPLTIKNGDLVTVRVTIKDNPGITMFITRLSYDPEMFELVNTIDPENKNMITDAVIGDILTSRNQFRLQSEGNVYGASSSGATVAREEGLVVELTFRAKNVKAGIAEFRLESTAGDVMFDGMNMSNLDQFSIQSTHGSVKVHNMVVSNRVAPTCTKGGYTKYTCSGCDYSETKDIVDKLGHTPVYSDYTAPTCTEPGYTGGAYCSVCNEVFQAAGEIPATGHVPAENAICTENSYCTVCEELLREATEHTPGAPATCEDAQTCTECHTELSPALGHTPGDAATCTEAQVCTVCGDVLAKALGHTPGAPATCADAQTCTVCGEIVADKKAHNWSDWQIVKEATEEEEGRKIRICINCTEMEEEIIPKLGQEHNYVANVILPTCTKKGYTEYICTHCGESYVDDYVDPIPHDNTYVVTEPTCVDQGYTTYTCTVCGYEEKADYVDATGHDESGPDATCASTKNCLTCGIVLQDMTVHAAAWDMFPKKEATCVEEGYESYIFCNTCNVYAKEKVVIPATGVHTPGDEATCTEAQTCTVCNTELTAAKGHTPGAEATCTAAQTCTVCNTELAAAKGHTPGAEATCTTAQTCTVCNTELAAAKGHTPGAEATCTAAQTCTVCNTELAAAKGHTPGAAANCTTAQTCTVCNAELAAATGHTEVVDEAVAATCTTEGKTEGKHCSACGEVLTAQEKVDPTGHTEGEWVIVQEPAIGVEGLRQKTCTVCGEVVASEAVEALTAPETTGEPEPATKEEVTTVVENIVTEGNTEDESTEDDGCFGTISGTGMLLACMVMAGGAWFCSSRKKEQA